MAGQDSGKTGPIEFLLSRIDYERAISVPYNQREFRLDRMRALLAHLGNPQDRLKIVHVAGTKGKGSTSAMIAAALSAAGYKTGLYTSPHLERIEERIVVNGQACTVETFLNLFTRVRSIVEQMDDQGGLQSPPHAGSTYFEIVTAIALLHFAERPVDAAVIEVGLGGRLDSTNVCQPLISVITSISFDHTQQLGNTLAKIAAEKAGIIKQGIPTVSGVTDQEPRRVITEIAEQQKSRLIQLGVDFTFKYHPPYGLDKGSSLTHGKLDFENKVSERLQSIRDIELGLLGNHQAANAAIALAALAELTNQGWKLPEAAVRHGLANAHLPARVEIVSRQPTIVIDAAHNVASAASLVDTLCNSFAAERRLLVFAASKDKDVRGMLQVLLPHFKAVILTRYLNNPRVMNLEELEELTAELSSIPLYTCPNPAAAWQCVCGMAAAEHLICATGSFFLAAEMRSEIAKRPFELTGNHIMQRA